MSDGGMSPDPLEIARRESRAVLNERIRTGRRLEDEARQSARTAVIVLGVLVGAAGIVGAQRLVRIEPIALGLFGVGAILLLTCQYIGLIRVGGEEFVYGIGDVHRDSAVKRDLRSDYLKELLDAYNQWNVEMADRQAELNRSLFVAHMSLIGGVVAVTIGGVVVVLAAMV